MGLEEKEMIRMKQAFCDAFCDLINSHTREHIDRLEYIKHEEGYEEVIIWLAPHYSIRANVTMDSRFAMIKDIMKQLELEF